MGLSIVVKRLLELWLFTYTVLLIITCMYIIFQLLQNELRFFRRRCIVHTHARRIISYSTVAYHHCSSFL